MMTRVKVRVMRRGCLYVCFCVSICMQVCRPSFEFPCSCRESGPEPCDTFAQQEYISVDGSKYCPCSRAAERNWGTACSSQSWRSSSGPAESGGG